MNISASGIPSTDSLARGRAWLAGIWTVARAELRFQRRGPTLWLLALLYLGAPLFVLGNYQAQRPVPQPSLIVPFLVNYTGLAIWYALIAPALVLSVLHRDRRRAALLWSRPVEGTGYLLGKLLALAMLVGPLTLASELVNWAGSSRLHGVVLPPFLFASQWLLVVVPAVAVGVLVTLALSLVVPHPLPALGLWWGLVAVLELFQPRSMLFWQNLFLDQLWYSPAVRFGPDTALLLSNRLIWLAIVLALPPLYRRRYPAVALRRPAALICGTLLLVATLIGAQGVVTMRAATTLLQNPETPAVAVPVADVNVTAYRADLRLQPDSSTIGGVVGFTLLPTGSRAPRPGAQIALAQNTGLVVDEVTARGVGLVVHQQPGLATFALPFRLPLAVQVRYHGLLRISRASYGGYGMQGGGGYGGSLGTVTSYASAPFTYLINSGDWYPVPQTVSATHSTPWNVGWRHIAISLPADGTTVDSADTRASRDGRQTLSWERPRAGVLPGPLLARCESCSLQSLPGGRILTMGETSAADAEAVYGRLLPAYRQVAAVMGATDSPTIVPMPLFSTPIAGGTGTHALLFVPEQYAGISGYPDDSMAAAFGSLVGFVPMQQQRGTLGLVAEAWWAGHAMWRGAPYSARPQDTWNPQEPHGTLAPSLMYGDAASSPLTSLTVELAARSLFGDHYFQREWRLRESLWHHYLRRGNYNSGSDSSQGRKLFALGVGPAGAWLPDNADTALSTLTARYGVPRMERFLRQMVTHQHYTVDGNQDSATREATILLLDPRLATFWRNYIRPTSWR